MEFSVADVLKEVLDEKDLTLIEATTIFFLFLLVYASIHPNIFPL